MERNIKWAAQMAIDVQSACNLSGVVISFGEAIKVVRKEADRQFKGTTWINTHPVCVLFGVQVAHLTVGSSDIAMSLYNDCTEACKLLAEGGEWTQFTK